MKYYRLTILASALCFSAAVAGGGRTNNGSDVWRPADGMALVTDALTDSIWVGTATLRTTSAVMQSFDVDVETGLFYYSQLNNKYRVYICWSDPDATQPQGVMELHYFGHGSNFSIEKDGETSYLWIGNYASKNHKGDYWNSQIVSRIPVKADAVIKPWDCSDNFYFGESNISVAVDAGADRLAVLGISSGNVRIYRLSELLALPVVTVELEPMIYGGGKAPDDEVTAKLSVQARNCAGVEPLGRFHIPRVPGISWQGFDICGDVFYQSQGNGNNNDGQKPSTGYLLVFDKDGTPLLERTPFGALADMEKLSAMGITDTGYMEPEGVKMRRGVLYCGFASKNSNNERRATIFRFSPAQSPAIASVINNPYKPGL